MSRTRTAVALLFAGAAAIGIYMGVGTLAAPSGYAAGYSFGSVFFLAAAVFAVAVLITVGAQIWTRGKSSATILILGFVTAACLLVAFYAAYGIGVALFPHRWDEAERLRPLDSAPRLGVVFKSGASETEIERFLAEKIQVLSPDGRGHTLRPGVRSIVRTGDRTLSVGCAQPLRRAQCGRLKEEFESSPIVARVVAEITPERAPNGTPAVQRD